MKMEMGKRYRLKDGVTIERLTETFALGGGSVTNSYIDEDYELLVNAEYLKLTTSYKLICCTRVKETHFGYSESYVADGCNSFDVFEEVVDEVITDDTPPSQTQIDEAIMTIERHRCSVELSTPTIQVPPTVPTDTVSIPVIEGSIRAIAQVAHTKSETDELVTEIDNNKHFAALLEAGDVVCSGYRAMKVLIEENNFNCTPQEILNMIAVKNNMRRYYDNLD